MRAVALLMTAALAVALPASRARADDTIKVKLITITPESGQEDVEGTFAVKAFTVKGKHGTMEVPAAKLGSLDVASRSTEEGPVVVVYTVDNQRFEGVIVSPKTLDIAGKYGRFSTSWEDVHELKVVDRPDTPDDDEEDDDAPDAWEVRIETESGDRLTGPLWSVTEGAIDAVEIDCDFGSLCFDSKKIRSIQFDPEPGKALPLDDGHTRESVRMERSLGVVPGPDEPLVGVDTRKWGTIIATDGRKLSGTITVPSVWGVETDLGYLSLKADKLKSITFEGPAELRDLRTSRPARTLYSQPTPPGDGMRPRPGQSAPVRVVPDSPVEGASPEQP